MVVKLVGKPSRSPMPEFHLPILQNPFGGLEPTALQLDGLPHDYLR